jgi:hypothetical protein
VQACTPEQAPCARQSCITASIHGRDAGREACSEELRVCTSSTSAQLGSTDCCAEQLLPCGQNGARSSQAAWPLFEHDVMKVFAEQERTQVCNWEEGLARMPW